MDEIFAAVDPITIENIKKIIVNLQVNKNISILITDHAFDNVLQISDKIFIISDGKIISSKYILKQHVFCTKHVEILI